MPEQTSRPTVPIPADQVTYLISTAARAPSVHNTQPWRFRAGDGTIDLYADPRRRLRVDKDGREMLISCGAALFGLRLAVRSLGYLPVVEMFPDPPRLRLLARVRLGEPAPMTAGERQLVEALPRRHTHRGPFAPGLLPAGLLAALQHDALAEGATLALIDKSLAYQRLADITSAADRRQRREADVQEEIRHWSRDPDDRRRDGVPAAAIPARSRRQPGRLPQRDFDLGRSLGLLPTEGPPAAATVILLTSADHRADWLRAGQALQRVLTHAATRWVFASLHTQPLEMASIRLLIRDRLSLPGAPQMIMQFGLAHSTRPTPRRSPADLIEP
jgi:hypothetical protein